MRPTAISSSPWDGAPLHASTPPTATRVPSCLQPTTRGLVMVYVDRAGRRATDSAVRRQGLVGGLLHGSQRLIDGLVARDGVEEVADDGPLDRLDRGRRDVAHPAPLLEQRLDLGQGGILAGRLDGAVHLQRGEGAASGDP